MKEAEAFLHDKQRDALAGSTSVGKLVEGFETPFGLELLATVHWVVTRENAATAEDAAAKVYAWNERKKRFSPRQIGIAFETLRAEGLARGGMTTDTSEKGLESPHRRRHDGHIPRVRRLAEAGCLAFAVHNWLLGRSEGL